MEAPFGFTEVSWKVFPSHFMQVGSAMDISFIWLDQFGLSPGNEKAALVGAARSSQL
jgi:hypothetical protein